jgi:hypothetical protein
MEKNVPEALRIAPVWAMVPGRREVRKVEWRLK